MTQTNTRIVQIRAAGITWDYKKVKWDSIGITEKLLGLQRDSEQKGHKLVWDSLGILKKASWDYIGITEINSLICWDS